MRIPRNISGDELAKSLAKYGYHVTRQTGSHLRLTTTENGEHHITIPAHNSLKVGIAKKLKYPVPQSHCFRGGSLDAVGRSKKNISKSVGYN